MWPDDFSGWAAFIVADIAIITALVGIIRFLIGLRSDLDFVKHELSPNSGKSIKDAVVRLDETVNGDGGLRDQMNDSREWQAEHTKYHLERV